MVDREGNWMYEQDRTPTIYPPRNPEHAVGGCSRQGRFNSDRLGGR